MKRLFAAAPWFLFVATILAQRATPTASPTATIDPAAAAAATTAVAGLFGLQMVCCFGYVFFLALMIGAWIFTGIFVMNDAKNRNSENAQTVTLLGWLIWPVGLIMHLATRPKGNLVPCPHCQKKRLEGSATCPHCHQP
jgi:disulfide bond formation protein DsbB